MKNTIIIFFLIILVFLLGIVVGDKKIFPYNQLKQFKNQITKKISYDIFDDISSKEEIDCSKIKEQKKLVIFTFSQSNSANHGSKKSKYTVKNNVLNIYKGKCYIANDPLLGASGKHGSVWGRLGDLIIENTKYETILIKSIGIGGLSVSEWSKKPLLERIEASMNEIEQMGLKIDIIFWHQGETDSLYNMEKNEYKKHFHKILETIREKSVNTPISFAISSYIKDSVNLDIVKAQKELIQENQHIYEGVNTDLITGYRDGVHFSKKGLDKFAKEWFKNLKKENLLTNIKEKD